MAKKAKTAKPTIICDMTPERTDCTYCGHPTWADYANHRTVHTLNGVTRLNMTIRRCHHSACSAHKRPYRPEAEGSVALPRHEFGLDVIALIGRLRYAEHRSVPEIRSHLVGRHVAVSERAVTNLLERYDELLAVVLADDRRLKQVLVNQGRVLLAIDGLQPDVGHEVLWVLRDCLSGEILLAKSLLSARQQDLGELLSAVQTACPVPVAGIVSDGQHSIRKAVASVFPGVPHQLCQFHYLREAGRLIYEKDRHAKKELKKKVRNVRGIERQTEGRTDPEAEVIRGYCSAVRSALTDDGRPPLEASGLKLHGRLSAIGKSLETVEKKKDTNRTSPVEGSDREGVKSDCPLVATDCSGLRMGASGRPYSGSGRNLRLGRPPETRRTVGGHATASRRDGHPPRSGGSLRESQS